MPYSKCPVCGAIAHLSVSDVRQWYATYYPSVPVGDLVPGKCFYCWPDLPPGTRVVIRNAFSGEAQGVEGAHGVVQKVISSAEDGNIYLVHLTSGDERYFIRAELRKPHEGEVEPDGGRNSGS